MTDTRKFWIDTMLKISNPVLENLSKETLKKNIPTEFNPHRQEYILLEAFGRTICGIAPWLELENVTGEEKLLQEKYRQMSRKAMEVATNPASSDYMNFSEGYGQSLVDAAFLAHGIVRAPKQLYELLDEKTKSNLIAALKATRKFTPFVCNWIFFSAMIEAALFVMGVEDYDLTRVDYAVNMFKNWYMGDGVYGDGPKFHWDYYNSFVIQPMFLDILKVFKNVKENYKDEYSLCLKRASRYAEIQERLINTDGTYPIIGRSITYRFGAFQLLSQSALQEFLPKRLSFPQVRCALTAVIKKVTENPNMFDKDGWLLPGVYGHQKDLAEDYICVGSLYLCNAVFLPLGLSCEHDFWKAPDELFTAEKIWSGENISKDVAID